MKKSKGNKTLVKCLHDQHKSKGYLLYMCT